MLIDLHCHTKYSKDNALDPLAFVRLAAARGLDAVCLTEHNSLEASAPVVPLGRAEGLLVLQGVEVTTDVGHILCFGLHDDGWLRLRRGYYTRFAALRDYAAARGAVLVPAHPFRQWSNNSVRESVYTMDGLTALEVVNGTNAPVENAAARHAADLLALGATGGSDSHYEDEVARVATQFDRPIGSLAELVEALRDGAGTPVVRDTATGIFAPPPPTERPGRGR